MNRLGLVVAAQGVMIAVLLVALVMGRSAPVADAQQIAGAAGGMVLQPLHLLNTASVAYVLDVQNSRLLVYEYEYNRGLRLMAARNITWDLKMESYNALPPSVLEVRDDYLKTLEQK